MPQLNYSQNAIIAQPGMPFDGDIFSQDWVSRPCATPIPFGAYCELDANGRAVLMQDSGTTTTFLPKTLGIAMAGPFVEEEDYVPWSVPVTLAGTVTLSNGSASITFSTAQTLAAGTVLDFSDQPGVLYTLATALAAGTAGTLSTAYTGTGGAGKTTISRGAMNSTTPGYKTGRVARFMRKGRIWVLGDGGGTSVRSGTINVNHSSDGTHAQGVFTFTAAQVTAGNEIDVAPNCLAWNPDLIGGTAGPTLTDSFGNVFKTYPVEINL